MGHEEMGGGHRNGQLRKAEVSSCCRKKREPLQARERGMIGSVLREGSSVWWLEVKGQKQPQRELVKES